MAGANEEGYHLRNVNYGRDYQAEVVADITAAGEGDACPNCGAPMRSSRGVEVGNIFKLGTRYSLAMGCNFSAENGESLPVIMGSYGIGVGRLLACIAEEHHDDKGLAWPAAVAPYPLHMVVLGSKTGQPEAMAADLETRLQAAGLEALVDDRPEVGRGQIHGRRPDRAAPAPDRQRTGFETGRRGVQTPHCRRKVDRPV